MVRGLGFFCGLPATESLPVLCNAGSPETSGGRISYPMLFRPASVPSWKIAVLVALSVSSAAVAADATVPSAAPRLAVVISLDQFRADYLVKFRPYFGEGGFKRFLESGTDFRDCHYRHSVTQTAPGHATILSGVHANVHGITSNEWLVRDSWEVINSVEDPDSPLVGITPAELGPVAAAAPLKTGRSPRNFQAETVGDQLKARFGADSKVFAASNKDRSAILLGGKKADAAYWDENGKMITSRYYRETLPAWVEAFNAERRVHGTFGQTWERVLEPAVYEAVQGPDDAVGEAEAVGFSRTFPKKITGGKDTITPAFFTAFDNSPFSAEFLGEFAARALREEKLGQHRATDVLCVSFSQIDTIGHNYGPQSHEVMDSVIRMDRVLARLFAAIDREVGAGKWLAVLSADHGVSPLPEQIQAKQGTDAGGRVRSADMDAAVKKALDAAYGAPAGKEYWFTRDNAGYHLRPSTLAAKNVNVADAAKIVKEAVAAFPYVAETYTRDELLAIQPVGDSLPAMMRRSYRAASDRDVVFVFKPYFLSKSGSGTSHGTPYPYDTHVPQLWYGAGIRAAIRGERVNVDDIAPTLAGLLGVPVPNGSTGRRLL